jgi:hypothetical protein
VIQVLRTKDRSDYTSRRHLDGFTDNENNIKNALDKITASTYIFRIHIKN